MVRKDIVNAVLIIVVSLSTSCMHTPPKPNEQLNSWFDVQKEYARVLDSHIGGDQYKIVPILGPIYSLGTPIRLQGSSPITNSCQFNKDDLSTQDFSPVPLVKEKKSFGLNLKLPPFIQNILKEIAGIGVKVDSSKAMELNYMNLSQVIATEDIIEKALRVPDCLNAIKGKKLVLIRGYIRGSLKATSDSTLDIDSKVTVFKSGELSVTYTDQGGFSIEDTKSERPRFFVVSEVEVTTKLVECADCKFLKSVGKSAYDTTASIVPSGGVLAQEVPVLSFSKPSQASIEGLISDK